MSSKNSEISIREQVDYLLRGTRFADEVDDWRGADEKPGGLRAQAREELTKKLSLRRPLRVYLGVDPTGRDLHVGHFVPLRKLRQFQEMGHQAIFLIGDYTAMIGDPSERETERRRFTHEEVLALAESYTDQAFRILDPEKTEIRQNSEWLSKLSFADIIELASIFPLKQIIARRDFQDRMARGDSLRFHEALYALMQGYDAHALQCDVQVGAYDQHFNMLAGRAIQEHFGQAPHVMVTNPLLTGTDGRKMSKSYENTINIRETPFDMYGKTMRITDPLIPEYLELASSIDRKEVDRLVQELRSGVHPMEIKKRLAFHLVSEYHGEEAAREAEEKFQQVVQKKEAPEEVPEVAVPADLASATWVDVLAALSLTKSKGEARRLIGQGGFYVNQDPVKDVEQAAQIPAGGVLIRLGKRRYYRLIPRP